MPLDDAAQYWIARGQTTFGPYTGEQVRAYLASGNIVLTDMIRGERDTEWMPVSFAVHAAPPGPPVAPPAAGGFGVPPSQPMSPGFGYPGQPAQTDEAAGLAWTSLILGVLGILCCGIFAAIPGLICGIVAMKKPPGPSRGIAIAGVVVNILGIVLGILGIIVLLVFPQMLGGMNGMGRP
jgi:hypothetical protein